MSDRSTLSPMNIEQGRRKLQAWLTSKPDNFFTSDLNLQRTLQRYLDDYQQVEPHLAEFGEICATLIDELAKEEDQLHNHPQLKRWSGVGERIEQVEFHPHHDTSGKLIWQSGLMAVQAEPGNTVYQMGLYYLLGHNGEAGHLCSLACTSGMIRVLQQVGHDYIQNKFLPLLLDKDYSQMNHAAQFLTEVQGGSDVGANAVQAVEQHDGTWRISGEKWFCSNINAEQFLMTARPEGAPDGTRGLGLFLVPRTLEDGSVNGFYIRRLKDKLGTRTLASAEADFVDALAYPVGPLEDGFKNAVSLVLNTSRLLNAVACAGIMRRAYIEAAHYACHRDAFGHSIAHYPLVQEAIADLYSEAVAAMASSFFIAHLLDKIETGQANKNEEQLFRLLVNINKYITSIRGTEMVHRAIEVLGGNGAIESFSILPRLYRDLVVLESWEGTHNVLCVQVLRDMQRYQIHLTLFAFIDTELAKIEAERLQADVKLVHQASDHLKQTILDMQDRDDLAYAQAHIRRIVDNMAHLAQATLLLIESDWELEQGVDTFKPIATTYFINRHLRADYNPMQDEDYLDRLARFVDLV